MPVEQRSRRRVSNQTMAPDFDVTDLELPVTGRAVGQGGLT